MKTKNVFYLPSGRIFLFDLNGYLIEATEMRDVLTKNNIDVRTTQDPHIIWKNLDNYENKWLLTVSTQKGCSFKCRFCDVSSLKFEGNLTSKEIQAQIHKIIEYTPYVNRCQKVKIGFARMGEPACNLYGVLEAMQELKNISKAYHKDFNWLPCFNSILPKGLAKETIKEVINIKENCFFGYLHFQLSINTTNEVLRKKLFGEADVMSLPEIISEIDKYKITNRTITLNFIVMENYPVDIKYLKSLGISGNRFTIKLIPLNTTMKSKFNKLNTYANYASYEKLENLKKDFEEAGLPVVMDSIAKCEEAGLCCGQLAQIYQ